MVTEIMRSNGYDGRTVLICWEHTVIPQIAVAFGVADAPTAWGYDVYDKVWVITFGAGGQPSLSELPKRLMFRDSEK